MKSAIGARGQKVLLLIAVVSCFSLLLTQFRGDSSRSVKSNPSNTASASVSNRPSIPAKPQEPPHKRLPDALVVGAGKCGTDALITYLNLSDTFVINTLYNDYHELNYFNSHYGYGTQWYIERMPTVSDDQVLIEKCAPYLWPPEVPQRVYNTSRTMKILMVLCDPVKRTVSLYTHKNSYKPEGAPDPLPPFTELIRLVGDGSLVEKSHPLLYQPLLESSTYSTFVKNWLKYFPREQMLFISGEDLKSQPLDILSQVTSFLGRPDSITDKHLYYNETRGYYCFKSNSGHRWCLDPTLKGRKHPVLADELLVALQKHYKPYNDELKSLIGIDFGWPKYFGQKS